MPTARGVLLPQCQLDFWIQPQLPRPANSPCFLLPLKTPQPGSPGILPSPGRLLCLRSKPRSSWTDQNPGPWVSPSYNGMIFSSPWPWHAPWLAAPRYPPLPRAATASCSQPSNGPRLPNSGRQGQGKGFRRQPSLHSSSQCELLPGGAEDGGGAELGQSTGPQGNPAPW